MHAENFDPIVLEVEFVGLRRDLYRVLRKRGRGEQQDGRQEADEWHCVFLLNCANFVNVEVTSVSQWGTIMDRADPSTL
jgi:hypothetical protein